MALDREVTQASAGGAGGAGGAGEPEHMFTPKKQR